MPKPVAKVGEGNEDASGNGVYFFIRDLIKEGKDARFVDKKGRYVINWRRALKRYDDYKSKRNPQYKSKNINRRKASNGLRAALLNFYKKEGAKEYNDGKKRNKNDEIVERQFQMPPRVFESLFGSNVQLSDDSSEYKTSSIVSEADEKPLDNTNSSDTGFDEAMDINFSDDLFNANEEPSSHSFLAGLPARDPVCSNVKTDKEQVDPSDTTTPCQMFGISGEELESEIRKTCSNLDTNDIHDLRGVVSDIFPSSGPMKGGMQFLINLTKGLSEDVKSGTAHFEGIDDISLERLNCYSLVGTIPASQQPGTVSVAVNTQDGYLLGMTYFTYVDVIQEVFQQVVRDEALQLSYLTMWSQEYGLIGNDGNLDPFTSQGQGSSVQGTHAQALKGLQLLVYTAAQTNAQQFIQMIFSTSAGRLVFNAYKDRPQLPEDVARANGHDDLAQYLQDVNARLSKENSNDAQPSSIDLLELLEAVNKFQKQSFVVEDETDLEIGQSKDDDNESDYFADAETSSCGSFELEFGWSDSEDGEEPCSKGGGSDKEPDVKSASSMNVMQWEAYAEVETQSDSDLDLEDDESYEEPGTVNSKPTLNLRSGTFRQLRKWRRACAKEVCEIQSSSQKIEVATQKRENTSEREQEAKACIGQEKWMQLKLRSGTFRQLRKWRRASVKEVCEIQSSSQKIGVATQKRENTSEREQEAKACIGQEKWMQLKSPFAKDERPKKQPDERLTQKNSMEGTSSEAPTVLGTNLDNEVDKKNDTLLLLCGPPELKSIEITKLMTKVAASGREEEARTAPSQEQTTKPKTTKPCTMSFSSERPVTNNNWAQSGIQNQLSKGVLTQQEYTIIPNCGRNRELGELHDHAVNSEEIPKDDPPTLERHISYISTVKNDSFVCFVIDLASDKTLHKRADDVTSTSYFIECSRPCDSTRCSGYTSTKEAFRKISMNLDLNKMADQVEPTIGTLINEKHLKQLMEDVRGSDDGNCFLSMGGGEDSQDLNFSVQNEMKAYGQQYHYSSSSQAAVHELPTSSSPQSPAYPHNIPYSPGPVVSHRNSSISLISTTPYETCSNYSEASTSGPSTPPPGLTSSYLPIHARLPTISSTTEYPGNWSFQISFGPLTESASKSATWTYSDVCKKLYVNRGSFYPIKFKTSSPPPPGTYLRAVAVFKGSTNLYGIVKRCLNHMESSNDGSAPNKHFIRSNNPAARYHICPESSRHSVLLPYNGPQVGTEFVTEMLAFMCFSSCASGPSRRPVDVIFTLEREGQTLGRRVLEISVCALPGLDRKSDEKVAFGEPIHPK